MTIFIEKTVVYIDIILHLTISTKSTSIYFLVILQILTTAADGQIHSKALLLLHAGK